MILKESIEILKKEINNYCTENVAFRLLTRSDIFPLYQATLNTEFNSKLAWGPPAGISDVVEQGDLLLREMTSGQSIAVSLVEKNTGAWIGMNKFSIYKDGLINTIWIHPDYWAKPMVIFATSSTIEVIFNTTDIEKIYAKHAIGYSKTEKLIKRNGFTYLYDEPVAHANGTEIMCKTYLLLKENWRKYTAVLEY
jgi:RimJ/RimL family protein N-acetyltransferase